MYGFLRSIAIAACVLCASSVYAQRVVPFDPPKPYVAKQAPTRQEIEHRQSLHLYVRGLVLEREDRFADALKAFEEAARLDPETPALVREQIRILILAERLSDAVAACKTVVRLDPGDFGVWYTQAKLQRTLADYPGAIAALERGVKADRLKDNPAAAQQ